jgi:hypothetical protein
MTSVTVSPLDQAQARASKVARPKKSTVLELSLSPDYVKSWGVWEALREFTQNGLDAHDQGFPFQVTRSRNGNVKFNTKGCILTRDTLLLGVTSKDSGLARGQFGEGYKLACLVLARAGYALQIRTGSEIWTPFLEQSSTFGRPVLKVRIRGAATYVDGVVITVDGLTDVSWGDFVSKVLDVSGIPGSKVKARKQFSTNFGHILCDPSYRGVLFARGLFVTKCNETYRYGYNFSCIDLDRDRKTPSSWGLASAVYTAIKHAHAGQHLSDAEAYDLATSDYHEAQLLAGQLEYAMSNNLTGALTREFRRRFGDLAVPVANQAETAKVGHYGRVGIICTKAILAAAHAEGLSFASVQSSLSLHGKATYPREALSSLENENLSWALRVAEIGFPRLPTVAVQVCDFYDENIQGTYHSVEGVRLARAVLKDRANLIAVLVHELAHVDGASDGTAQHRDAIDSIFGAIVAASVQ